MRLGDVLAQVEGLNKRFVYYLEAQGYIQPRKVRKERISRRDYGPDDVERIREIWSFYRRGFTVQAAEAAARESQRLTVWALLPVPSSRWEEVFDLITDLAPVREASFVYGESSDLVLRILVREDWEVHRVLDELFDRGVVGGIPRVLKVLTGFERVTTARPAGDGRSSGEFDLGGGSSLQAYVLLKVPAKQAGGVLEALRGFPEVAEASVVYGETDIIARVVVPDQDALDEVVLGQIQRLPMVESTRTFLVVGRMQWRRDATPAAA